MAWFQVDFMSQSLNRSVPFNVLLPADARFGMPQREERLFKTLYLLHGLSGDQTSWLTLANTAEYSQINDLAIVMPAGECSFYLDNERSGRLFSEFIGVELVDFTRRVFPLSRKREDTFIGGLSMGGYGALYNGFKHNDVFSRVIALSSAILLNHMESAPTEPSLRGVCLRFYEDLAGGDIEYIRKSDKNLEILAQRVMDGGRNLPDLYIACGYNDSLVYNNRNFSAFLDSIGYKHVYEEGAGTHDWAFWGAFLKRGLERLALATQAAQTPPFWVDAKDSSPNPVMP